VRVGNVIASRARTGRAQPPRIELGRLGGMPDPRVSVRCHTVISIDVGTSFQLRRAGHTRKIVVREGAVLFRNRESPHSVLTSPVVWVAPPATVEFLAVAKTNPNNGANRRTPTGEASRSHTRASRTSTRPASSSNRRRPPPKSLLSEQLALLPLRREPASKSARSPPVLYQKVPAGIQTRRSGRFTPRDA